MGFQERPTKLPLATFARLMGVNPLHFEGVQIPEIQRVSCDVAWPQFSWQDTDALSREELAEAIAQAEAEIEQQIGYRLLPSWEFDERQPTIRPNRPELLNINGLDVRGYHQTGQARWGHFVSGGIRAKAELGLARPIVYASTKAPADYEDEATVTATVDAGTEPCEVRVYYPGKTADDRFEIRPISVVVAGTTATITFARELAVLESELDSQDLTDRIAIDGENDLLFLTTVDVFRLFNDPQTQVSFLWEPIGGECDCFTSGSSCVICAFQTQTGCIIYRGDPRNGVAVFQPAAWDAATEAFTAQSFSPARNPDQLRLFYYAGLEDKNRDCPRIEMDRAWATTVARLAAARLDRPPCSCNRYWWDRWTADLAFTTGAVELASYSMTQGDLGNPFGTRRGEVYAWRQVNRDGVRAGNMGIAIA